VSHYVIVGGGIAGLVVARRLALAGQSVIVLEARDYLGGTLAAQTVDGLVVDSGAESFATRGGTVAALATELGLGGELVTPTAGPAWLYRASGDAVPLPATSTLGVPGIPLAQDVIDVVGFGAAFRAYLDVLIPGFVGRNAATIGDLVRRRMGAGVLEGLVTPVVRGVHSAHPDELSLDRVAPFLKKALASEGSLSKAVLLLRAQAPAGSAIMGIRGGMNRLVVELLADLQGLGVELRTGARVDSVTAASVVVGGEAIAGRVVVAAAGVFEANATRGITIATIVVSENKELDAAPRGTGLLIADDAPGVSARALTHSTAKWEWLAERAQGRHVIRLSYDEGSIDVDTARSDAATLLGVQIRPSDILAFDLVDWTRPAPQGAAPDGVTAVGEAVAGSGLAAVIAHAEATAIRLLAEPEPESEPDVES
jgi:oxygen-dependent protoporphyrinogen oxidase